LDYRFCVDGFNAKLLNPFRYLGPVENQLAYDLVGWQWIVGLLDEDPQKS
jgi:hypothetical protein